MLAFVRNFNFLILVLFFLCYSYQIVYIFICFLKKDKKENEPAKEQHKFAVLISARNESAVIGELLDSINQQTYPKELLDVYVVADNCTDNTAQIARDHGAKVFERFNKVNVGKGYALDYAFAKIDEKVGVRNYEGYLVFDADNVLDPHYVEEMNRTFDRGYRVITSYRNSKNYDSNWISAGYALWFLRESTYLNGARMLCHSSCAISGTGFLVSSEIIEKNHGWKHHLLTEDIEFSIDNVIQGEVIGYCKNAVVYDEQPTRFGASWKQRMRWAKGFYQVLQHYGRNLLAKCVKGRSFQCFDMMMTIAPATLLTLGSLAVNLFVFLYGLANGRPFLAEVALAEIGATFMGIYLSLFMFGAITTATEWKRIYCSPVKKLAYMFTFPIFIFTYVPIAIAALFKPVQWEPVHHSISKNVNEIQQRAS
ncbi:glycosyltransferase family 2 protein [Anaerolentibacter hominis]|uniref:glycosyltransferase family 2 protein n=1 Tax=Anaerolentibacter hominis TaxID=3079009 RepID=UPI0031B83B5D